jgi:two-component system phosphate regulon sensor histidine kinase PhoR
VDIGWIVALGLAALCVGLAWQLARTRAARDAAENAARRAKAAEAEREQQAALAEAMLRALAAASIDPIYLLDGEGRIALANPAAEQLFPDGKTGESLIVASRSAELDAIATDVLRDEYEFTTEITLNGRLFRVHAAQVAYPQAAGPAVPLYAMLLLRDVSELQRLGRARRDFVANISHELRTPLQAMRLLLDGARARPEPLGEPSELAAWIERFDGQVASLTQLTQELYDLSQIESGQLPMMLRPEPLRDLAASVIATLTPLAERSGLRLENLIPDETQALVDAAQLKRVLSNLIHNAIKFTERGGISVRISDARPPGTRAEGDFITLGVRDSGAGISREEQPRIFERFYKADRARGKSGTGLGLAIAKHIIERHGGQIWVESTLGRGSTFWMTVPAG